PTDLPTDAPTATATASPTEIPPPPSATSAATATATELPPPTSTTSPAVIGGAIAMRRLTAAQYKASIADVLGSDIVVAGRMEPDNRRDGLLAVGGAHVSVTAPRFEQRRAIRRHLAGQA